jgi:hypothetical protein
MGCQPPMKYWIPIPIRLDTIQYSDSPLGRVNEKKAIIRGISQSIITWLVLCLGSVEGVIVSFCCTQVDTNTNKGMIMLVGSGSAKSSQRKFDWSGATA